MAVAPNGACGSRILSMWTKSAVGGVVLTYDRISENGGYIFGQQRSDGDQGGADHGGVVFEKRPDHYVGAVPYFVVSVVVSKGWVAIRTCCIEGADLVGHEVFQTNHTSYASTR